MYQYLSMVVKGVLGAIITHSLKILDVAAAILHLEPGKEVPGKAKLELLREFRLRNHGFQLLQTFYLILVILLKLDVLFSFYPQ